MESKDYYAVLGVKQGVSENDLRFAYRKLAHRYHPDVSQAVDAQTRMREINEAYEVLRDTAKRATYDDLRAREKRKGTFVATSIWGREMQGIYAQEGRQAHRQARDFRTFVAALFKGKPHQVPTHDFRRRRGEDYHAQIEIALEDTLQGTTRVFTLHRMQRDTIKTPQLQTRNINVSIPAGIREGQRICVRGQGMPGYANEAAGDLYLEVRFKPHHLYQVDGADLWLTLPVSPWEAALGAVVTAPTLAGPVQVSIPPGSCHGNKLRLKGCGLSGRPRGDLYLMLSVVLPPAETETQQQAYRDWAQQVPFDPRAHLSQ